MNLLLNDYPLIILPALANAIGLNEAVILQQLHYWQQKSKSGWVYNTYQDWQNNFPFWSTKTIQRTFKSLESLGIVESKQEFSTNRQKYYRINYDKLDSVSLHQDTPTGQNDQMPTGQNDLLLITETNKQTETTVKTNREEPENSYQAVWEKETGKLVAGISAFLKMVDNFKVQGVTPEDYRQAIREQSRSEYPVNSPTSVESWAIGIAQLRKSPKKAGKSKPKVQQLDMSNPDNRDIYRKAWIKDE